MALFTACAALVGRLLGVAAILFAAVLTLAAQLSPAQASPDDAAIIITNAAYTRVLPVKYAHRDGAAFKRIATEILGVPDRPTHIIELPDVTFGQMLELFGTDGRGSDRLRSLFRGPASRVYVFYSGHGMSIEEGGVGYHVWLPVDSHPDSAAFNGYRRGWVEAALSASQVAKSKDGHGFIFMDACFSGGSGGGALVPDTKLAGEGATNVVSLEVPRLSVFSASGAREVAYWDDKRRRGVYSDALLFGLFGAADDPANGGNGDGRVTAGELDQYLRRRIEARLGVLHRSGARRPQTPGLIGDRDLVLAVLPAKRPEAELGLDYDERTQCRQLAAQPEPLAIRAFLDDCITCTPQCRTDLSAKAAALETTDRACALDRPRLAALKCPMDRARIADLAQYSECAIVKGDAAARLGAAECQTVPQSATLTTPVPSPAPPAAPSTVPKTPVPPAVKPSPPPTCDTIVLASGVCLEAGSGRGFRDVLKGGATCPDCPEMVVIPAGTFTIGSTDDDTEKPPQTVTIARPYALAKTVVTVKQYLACAAAKACKLPEWQEPGSAYNIQTGSDDHYKALGAALTTDDHPIVGVSHVDALAFAAWLTERTGQKYRLPSEAEWERAARGGRDGLKYWWGDTFDANKANGRGTSGGDRWPATSPVAAFAGHPYGLFDMSGNVWQWVADCWIKDYNSPPTGGAARTLNCTEAGSRVVRGGSWNHNPSILRSANRNRGFATYRYYNQGFRVGRSLGR